MGEVRAVASCWTRIKLFQRHTVILRPDLVSRQRQNLAIAHAGAHSYRGGQVRPVERSLSSRARLTVEERLRVPSLA